MRKNLQSLCAVAGDNSETECFQLSPKLSIAIVSCRKAFHIRGASTLKLRSLKLVHVRGTAHVLSYADRSKR